MTSAAFSSNESETIERTIDLDEHQQAISLADIWSSNRLSECTKWIRSNNFQRVSFKSFYI